MPIPIEVKSDNTRVYNPIVEFPKQKIKLSDQYEFVPIYDNDYNLIDYYIKDGNRRYNKSVIDTQLLPEVKDIIDDASKEKYRQRSEVIRNKDGSYTTHVIGAQDPVSPFILESATLGKPLGIAIKYGGTFLRNIPHRGRFFYNNLTPAAYGGHTKQLLQAVKEMATQKPPTFYNKNPKWYSSVKLYPEVRRDTWARRFNIPESEIPNTAIYRRPDNTFGFTPETLSKVSRDFNFRTLNLDDLNKVNLNPNETIRLQDWMTTIGGEHSDFKYLGNKNGYKFFEFSDNQMLNPQWIVADKVKKLLPKRTHKYIDKVASKDLGPLIGADKPVIFRQQFAFDDPDFGKILWKVDK